MNHKIIFLVCVLLVVNGCDFEIPLASKKKIKINKKILGRWQQLSKPKSCNASPAAIVLPYSDYEYLIHYKSRNHDIYYKGYPINIGGRQCLQLKVLGNKKGPVAADIEKTFQVIDYRFDKNILIIEKLSQDIIKKQPENIDKFQEIFLKHADNQDLFVEISSFMKVEN
jgi:hypothetical protein